MEILDIIPSWLSWDIATILFVFLIVILTFVSAKMADRLLKAYFQFASKKMKIDETTYGLVRRIIVAMVYFSGFLVIIFNIESLRDLSIALFAGAGFAGIVVGMAAQNTLSNIIAGVALATFRPFRVGDLLTIHGEYGKVTDITLGYTKIKTWDNRRLNIPNHIISDEAIINWSIDDPTVNWTVDIGISYDSNIDLARSIMIDEASKHKNVMSYESILPHNYHAKRGDEISVLLTELGDFAVNLRLYVWVRDRSIAYSTGCDLRESIKKRFDAEGIEIPFPYRTIVYKKDIEPSSEGDIEMSREGPAA
ncbi:MULTISPECIES: mechanosensitive ion channel family protein [Methanococcoides]|jgi:small-conductance mechanosensitive channel|uniref:Mechanosensitive ion channel family protein n=1 Tax=Methanococcoides seepicolus TaxID=2828780 RepID=A0A9E4ZG90_9EURY|nr:MULTISPECIES: mechanosensitive ion channel family protein [Methanococcoides]MCM1987095.1 mechanosensitive ion channel family protein [Methanococcoides seepicolus]NOQ48754.1 mechanosensitive ion channel [Methanococcoides sp.]